MVLTPSGLRLSVLLATRFWIATGAVRIVVQQDESAFDALDSAPFVSRGAAVRVGLLKARKGFLAFG
jgi:hypothetical protein